MADKCNEIKNCRQQPKRKMPMCARCRLHGVETPVKDHKYLCKYLECECSKCELFLKRKQTSDSPQPSMHGRSLQSTKFTFSLLLKFA